MKCILITGGAEFIGSEVVRQSLSAKFEVFNVDALTYAASEENLSDLPNPENYFLQKTNICADTAIK